jgi:hypothetical protein
MGKAYTGVGGTAKGIKKVYVGVGGVAQEVKKIYAGVGDVAKLVYSAAPVGFEVTLVEMGGVEGYNYTENAYVEYAINGVESYTRITSLDAPIILNASSIRFKRYTAPDWCVDIWGGELLWVADIGKGTLYTDWITITAPFTFYLAAYAF